MGQTKEQKILKDLNGATNPPKLTPIATEMYIPNHSGIASHPESKKNFVPYQDANADVDLGTFDLTAGDVTVNGLLNSYGNIHVGTGWAYDGYSAIQADGYLSARGSIQVRADTNYGGYGPSFDFNATESGGNNWRMVSTGNDDATGPGWYNFYQDPVYDSSPLAFSPARNVIVNGPAGTDDGINPLQVYGKGEALYSQTTGNKIFFDNEYGGTNIDSNLEVYTTSPDAISYMTMRTNDGGTYAVMGLGGANYDQAFFFTSAGNGMYFDAYYGNLEFRSSYGGDLVFNGNGEDGSILIGTLTDNGQKLQVYGTSAFGDGGSTDYSSFEADGTLVFYGDATVWNDVQFAIGDGRVGVANFPDWSTFTTNTKEYEFQVDDYIDLSANEMPHWWKEASTVKPHLHLAPNGLVNANRYAKFTVYIAYADANEVWTETSKTAEIMIPANTTSLTHLFLDMGDLAFTNQKIGCQVKIRVKRIAATGGTEYPNHIFITQVGIHAEQDTIGSRDVATK